MFLVILCPIYRFNIAMSLYHNQAKENHHCCNTGHHLPQKTATVSLMPSLHIGQLRKTLAQGWQQKKCRHGRKTTWIFSS